MIDFNTAPFGAFLLRVTLGLLFLAHASLKYFGFTPDGVELFCLSLGLPSWLGLAVMMAEFVAGLMLVFGVLTRLVAMLMILDLAGAICFVHFKNGFVFTAPGGGWEYPAFWAVALLVQALLGSGAFAAMRAFD